MKNNTEGFVNVMRGLFAGILSFVINSIKILHKEGYIFVLIGVVTTMIFLAITLFLGILSFIITCWIIYFFRDPHRIVPQNQNAVVSPADGTITSITQNELMPEELNENCSQRFTKVSIFLNVFNVHVNRVPIKGKIEKIKYIPGKFFNASLDKSSTENERNIILIKNENGEMFVFTQIAGLIARRIVCYAKENETFETGERYGIIRFGSRVDVFIPQNYQVCVYEGQTMIGGETILAQK